MMAWSKWIPISMVAMIEGRPAEIMAYLSDHNSLTKYGSR